MCLSCGCRPLARSRVYEVLSAGFLHPDPPIVEFLVSRLPDVAACLQHLGDWEPARSLETLMAAWNDDALQEDYVRVFGHTVSKECPPYASEYGQAHIFQQAQVLADIAGFYQAFGVQLSPSFKDRLDHVGVELEFLHFLCLKEAHAIAQGHALDKVDLCREAQRKFLDNHLGTWVFTFLHKLKEKARGGIYASWGELTEGFVKAEMQRLALTPGTQVAALTLEVLPEAAEECVSCPLVEVMGGGVP